MQRVVVAIVLGILAPSLASAGEGYSAGYRWAQQNGIDDPDYCYSRSGGYINDSPSFTEGCLEYLRDEGIVDDDDELVDEDDDESGEGGDE